MRRESLTLVSLYGPPEHEWCSCGHAIQSETRAKAALSHADPDDVDRHYGRKPLARVVERADS